MPLWQDRVVLVTGGSAGFGLAIARAFAQAGAKIVIAALNDHLLEPAAESLRAIGGDVTAIATDITNQTEVDRLFDRVRQQHGRLDVLVNCAGRSVRGAVLDTSVEEFQALWELNFLATVRCTRAAAPLLLETGGHIVNIGSLAAKSASRFLGAYPVSKHSVAAYSHQLRLELASEGVHVLLVCPGPLTRADGGGRYDDQTKDLPESARQPGAGVKLNTISPDHMAQRILRACRRRQPELIVPLKARLVIAISQLFPSLGDWIIRKMSA